jgi:hypothetical protein
MGYQFEIVLTFAGNSVCPLPTHSNPIFLDNPCDWPFPFFVDAQTIFHLYIDNNSHAAFGRAFDRQNQIAFFHRSTFRLLQHTYFVELQYAIVDTLLKSQDDGNSQASPKSRQWTVKASGWTTPLGWQHIASSPQNLSR